METSAIPFTSTPPLANAVVTLFDSLLVCPGGMRSVHLSQVIVNFLSLSQASAASGLHAYASWDKGVTYYEVSFSDGVGTATMPVTVAATSTGVDKSHCFDVQAYDCFKLAFTNGAANQTVFVGGVSLIYGTPVIAT